MIRTWHLYYHTCMSMCHVLSGLMSHYGVGTICSSFKSQVSFAKETYKRGCILKKRPIVSRSLLVEATPYMLHIIYHIYECCIFVYKKKHAHIVWQGCIECLIFIDRFINSNIYVYIHKSTNRCTGRASAHQIIGLFCRIQSLLQVSFARETCNFEEPTNRSRSLYSLQIMIFTTKESYKRDYVLQKRPIL